MQASELLFSEIRSQADIAHLAETDTSLRTGIERLATTIREHGRLRITGMGASYHAGRVLEPLLRHHDIDTDCVVTSDLLNYGPPRWDDPLLAISQSGASAEIEALLERKAGLPNLWGLTLDPDSPLGRARSLTIPGGPERAYSATRSFTGTLDVLLRLNAAITLDDTALQEGHRELQALVTQVPNLGTVAADALSSATTIVATGRGPLVGVAGYTALLIMELRRKPAMALEAAQLRHGPLEALNQDVGLIVLRADGPTTDLIDKLVQDAAKLGGPIVVIDAGPDGAPRAPNITTVRLSKLSEAAAALAAPAALQPAAMILAERAGINPGESLHATKVTRQL